MDQKSSIILTGLTREQLQEDIFKTVSKLIENHKKDILFGGINEELNYSFQEETSRKQTSHFAKQEDKYLTRLEVAKLLKVSLPTLHRYTKGGIIKSYRIVGKIRYKFQDIENALKERNFGFPKKGGLNG